MAAAFIASISLGFAEDDRATLAAVSRPSGLRGTEVPAAPAPLPAVTALTRPVGFRALAMLRQDDRPAAPTHQKMPVEPRRQTASPPPQPAPAVREEKIPTGRMRVPAMRVITLEQAYDLALATDQSIRNAYLQLRTAQLEPWSALTRIGPQLAGNLSYELIRERRFNNPGPTIAPLAATPDTAPDKSVGIIGGAGVGTGAIPQATDPAIGTAGTFNPDFSGTHNHTRRVGLFIQQPLLDLTVFPAWRFGKLSAASADLRRQYVIRETLFGVTQAYYAVLKVQAIVGVNRETVTLARDQVEVAESRFSLGDVARTDVLRAESVFQSARRTLIESEGLLDLDRNTLANILNLEWDAPFTVAEPAEAPPARDSYDAILASAFQRREDFRASALGIDQRMLRRQEVIASYAPRVVAQANHDWANVTTNTSRLDEQRIWSATVAVQVPFFTGGQREIDLRKARLAIDQAQLDHETLAKAIQGEVKQAWIDVRTFRESILALRAEAETVERTYVDLTNNYRAGTATSLDVAAGLRDRNNARATLAGTLYNYQIALRNLQRAEAAFQTDRIRRARVK